MSINAPATITFSGDVAVTITSTWGTKPSDSTISHASFTRGSVSATVYNMNDVFDRAIPLLLDIQAAASCTNRQAELVLKVLQLLVENYNLQANQTANLRLSIAVA